jgi:hypothetical protein
MLTMTFSIFLQNDVLYFPIPFPFSPLPARVLERKSKRPVGSFGKFDVKLSTGLSNGSVTDGFYETTVTVVTMYGCTVQ